MSNFQKRFKRKATRRGVTAVEFAMVVPVLLFFIFASMEFSRANMLRNMCENAAMQGARTGMLPGATAQNCIDSANEMLDIMGITDATVVVDPPSIDPLTEDVAVTVNIPLTENSLPMSRFVLGESLQQTVKFPREDH